MPYPTPEVWEFTLEELGAPELKVKCTDPRNTPTSVQKRIQHAMLILQRADRGKGLEPDEEWALSAMDDLMKKTILEWNLPDPETDEVISLKSDDPFGPLPGEVYEYITEQIGRRLLQPSKRVKR